MSHVLVASRNRSAREAIRRSLRSEYRVDMVSNKESCFELFKKKRYEFVFVDMAFIREPTEGRRSHNDYKHALQSFWQVQPAVQIIVMTSQERIREAVEVVKAGASNYLTYPVNTDEVKYVTESLHESLRMESELDYLRDRFWQSDSLEMIRTKCPNMRKVFDKIRSVAPTKTTVLLVGETGTGKSVLARLIHHHSNRRDRQFISVHCGAVPETLLESELFGHEKGAFTGAVRRKLGKFEIAQGGTIFLDEIGTITASAQIRLLQVLQERTFHRVGGETPIEADVRVIAASNIDLEKMCQDGLFRKDLYYRLNVFPIELPPLRERIDDIPLLVESFLSRLNKFYFKEIHDVHPQVMEAFAEYHWPGNIRELENLIERAYILESSSILTPESFPSELFRVGVPSAGLSFDTSLTLSEVRRRAIDNVERHYLKELLALHKGRINATARSAGITSRQVCKLLAKHNIRKEDFKS